jgi:hypothetical protein
MAKTKGLELPQQRGTFEVKGIVIGTQKEKFATSTKTKTGKDFRSVNFGITFDKNQTLFVGLTGMPQEKVYFSKKGEKGAKPDVKTVDWKDRHTFKNEGYTLIGVNCGLVKTTKDGKEVNDIQRLTPFDACKYIEENLKDGESVYIRGNIEYSHYANQAGELQHNSKLVITQISLCKPVDFEATDFAPDAQFTQPFVFMGISKEEPNFAVEAKVVGYATVEDAEFIVENAKLATNLKKALKPYNSIKAWGDIRTVRNTDTIEVEKDDSDGWGSKNEMDRVTGQYRKTFIVTGADPESMEKEIYKESEMDKAIATMNANENAKKDFGDGGEEDWGGSKIEGEKKKDDDEAWD